MTITGTEAYEAMRTHHRILGEQLGERVGAVSAAAAAGQPHEAAVAGLIAYLAGEILPHAAAEEATIYPAAAALDGLAGTVSEMTAEHTILSEAAGRLAGPAAAADAVRRAEEIARIFAGHVAKENDILLPALLASDGADLSRLLAEMHRRTEQGPPADPAEAVTAADPQATVLSLLLQAATALARESLSEARRSVHALRPGSLESEQLGDALAAVAEHWSALSGIAVQVTTTGTALPMRPEAD
ncbi:MAG: hemerythrin domain-containing protein, partial [Streptosporangiaceae bacterium]